MQRPVFPTRPKQQARPLSVTRRCLQSIGKFWRDCRHWQRWNRPCQQEAPIPRTRLRLYLNGLPLLVANITCFVHQRPMSCGLPPPQEDGQNQQSSPDYKAVASRLFLRAPSLQDLQLLPGISICTTMPKGNHQRRAFSSRSQMQISRYQPRQSPCRRGARTRSSVVFSRPSRACLLPVMVGS